MREELRERTLTNLYNKRDKGEAVWLIHAHAKLDAAVAAAYSFPADLSDEVILEKLLALNQERAITETAAVAGRPRMSRPKREEEML